MLRQFLTKALEIKRAEIAGLSGRGDPGQPPSTTLSSSGHRSPHRLTFYDVVQLARQQAYAEKTRRSNEDLIDLSDTPKPSTGSPASTNVQSDLALLGWSNPMTFQQVSLNSSTQNLFELDSSKETIIGKTTISELDSALPLNLPPVDLIGLAELDDSRADGLDKEEATELSASADIPNQTDSRVCAADETLISHGGKTNDQLGLEVIGTEVLLASGTETKGDLELCSPRTAVDSPKTAQQSSAAVSDAEDPTREAPDDKSVASSAPPSVFSHSSSLTSATNCSLPAVTEEEFHARNSSSQTDSKSAPLRGIVSASRLDVLASDAAGLPLQKIPALGVHAESMLGASAAPTTGINEDCPSKPQRTQSEDSVSLLGSRPQLFNIDEPDEKGSPWIVSAARNGDEEMVRKLLVSGADIQASHTSTRRHALAEASLQGHVRIADLLIEEGCSLAYTDAEGNTALHHACREGHLAVAKSLITANKACVNATGPKGQSALHLAMNEPYQNIVMLLIQHKANVNARDASSQTPLHIAASQGNVAMCTLLLSEGAQLDAREEHSKTALQIACEAGYSQLVQLMLDQSQLNPTNMTFLTAFFAAVEHGHVQIAESFFSRGLKLQDVKRDLYRPLTLAAKSGCLAMVELMIQENCDVNARDEVGWNALHFASYHGHYQVIERLFASGVSAKATTSRKQSPLLLAVQRSHFPVVERLLRSDNDSSLVSGGDERGQQPVHHAVRVGSLEILGLLMSNGGKLNVENDFGWQPLHIATAYGHLALVARLLQQGANIEEKLGSSSIKKSQTHKLVEEGYWAEARWPYPGSRALHLACEYSREQIANLLISKGAKMEASCGEGWQPLHHATYFGSSTLVEIMLQGGVNPHATTNEGKTASALGFCTTGTPIPEKETQRIQHLLKDAMDRVKRQKNFKMPLKKASTVEDKSKLLGAAAFSMAVVSRPQLHKAMTSMQVSDLPTTYLESTMSSHRPPFLHLPYTSPLPLKGPTSELTVQHRPSMSSLPASEAEVKLPPPNSTTDSSRASTHRAPAELSGIVTSGSTTDQATQPSTTDTTDATLAPPTEPQLSLSPNPKLKRRTTFGLAKVKPGLEMPKLSTPSMGMSKSTFDIGKQTIGLGKQTLELGTKTLELGKQGMEMSKLGFEERSRQGFEMGKKGVEGSVEMGRRGVEVSRLGLKRAKKFAKKGVGIKGKGTRLDNRELEGKKKGKEKVAGNGDDDNHDGNNDADDDEEEEEEGDDAKSEFSLGEFADLGSKDF